MNSGGFFMPFCKEIKGVYVFLQRVNKRTKTLNANNHESYKILANILFGIAHRL